MPCVRHFIFVYEAVSPGARKRVLYSISEYVTEEYWYIADLYLDKYNVTVRLCVSIVCVYLVLYSMHIPTEFTVHEKK